MALSRPLPTPTPTPSPPPNWTRPKISDNILEHIGNTPLVRINQIASHLDCEVLGKCEFFNAGGSIKDRIGKRMILDAEKSGRIKPGDTIIEPTSGNTGIGLAITALVRGYRMIITLPEKMSDEKMNMLKALGAEIIRTPTEAAWDAPESHIGVAKKLHAAIANSHILDQYANESNVLAHYEGTAEEILYQCDGRIDMLVCGAGTGGTISGVARKLKERLPHVKVVGVDPIGSILAEPASLNVDGPSYLVEGIGYDFIPQVLDRSLVDAWVKTDDACSLTMARRLLKEEGLMVGGSSGAAMHACLRAATHLGAGKRVVVILPDATRNYMSKFLSDEWMVEKGLLESKSLAVQPTSASLLIDAATAAKAEWWKERTVVDIGLPAPITVPPTMSCADAALVMKGYAIDQLPVVDDIDGVVGVVTLGQLTSKIVSARAGPADAVSSVMFSTFTQVPLSTPLGAFSRIFERNAFCLVVTPTRYHAPDSCRAIEKKVVVAVFTQFDLLDYVMKGPPQGPCADKTLPVTPDGAQLGCAQLAWAFMKPPSSLPSPSISPPRVRHEDKTIPDGAQLGCAQMAWQFMKPMKPPVKPPSPPTAPPTSPETVRATSQRSAEMQCSQMAWQFMKPPNANHTPAGPLPSPLLDVTSGANGLPELELGALSLSTSEQASAAATAVASPSVEAAPTVKGEQPPSFSLPKSTVK